MSWIPDLAVTRLQAVATWPEFATDRYTVVDEIGRGGMGTVYLARDETLGRDVAIKVSNAVASVAWERRLQTEARVLATLEHPGIVPIHDVGRLVDGRLFYVMKRVRGRTLFAELSALPELGDRLRIFERICEPVAFAHAHGVIHRDLKPDNIMVGAFGEVMVMDWGVAKVPGTDADVEARGPAGAPGEQTGAGTVLGTPGFMPPEQARGAADEIDERADVYGLGGILFMLLTGLAPPPRAEDAVAAMLADDRTIPRPLRAVCARAMAPVRADRYATVPALAADVARYRAGHAVDAHRETWLDRAARVGRTYRTPILLVLAYMIMRVIVALTVRW
jgi:eukaryotic-like serine/threonine-protein kinase